MMLSRGYLGRRRRAAGLILKGAFVLSLLIAVLSAANITFALRLGLDRQDLTAALIVMCGSIALYVLTTVWFGLLGKLFNGKGGPD